ncbi:MAG: hypothetical protein LBJ46_09255 [Planctomycetota bacterium]|jgi:L-alanine-DL-glutamate epimerase-like enolase superfamily enzyme|nr:hypothetical protein [Planctomycetota bacterium]
MADARISLSVFSVKRATLPFRFRFGHSKTSRGAAETLLLAVSAAHGPAGFGQVLARTYLSGETLDHASKSLQEKWLPALGTLRFPRAERAWEWLSVLAPLYQGANTEGGIASYSAVDVAAIDAVARACRVAGASFWGRAGDATPLVGVIPTLGPRKASWLVRAYRMLGYRRFKVKVGDDPGLEAARVRAVRKAAGRHAWIALDANAAWEPEDARERMKALLPFRPALVEEPLRNGREPGALRLFEVETGIPVMADESLVTLADAERFLAEGGPSWWNLRLAKVGGFSGIAAMGKLAAENGVNVYGGVLVGETSALAAASRACLGLTEFACMEYGFPRVLLKDDPFRGGPGGFRGVAGPLRGSAPGLGVKLATDSVSTFSSQTL